MQRKRKQHTCMFDWQATQTQPCLFSTLSKGESHFRSLVCIMRNSKYASTSIMCTLRNSKCAFWIKIQNTHFAVVWKQSKPPDTTRWIMPWHKPGGCTAQQSWIFANLKRKLARPRLSPPCSQHNWLMHIKSKRLLCYDEDYESLPKENSLQKFYKLCTCTLNPRN